MRTDRTDKWRSRWLQQDRGRAEACCGEIEAGHVFDCVCAPYSGVEKKEIGASAVVRPSECQLGEARKDICEHGDRNVGDGMQGGYICGVTQHSHHRNRIESRVRKISQRSYMSNSVEFQTPKTGSIRRGVRCGVKAETKRV
jgi:hypothetical protein